MGQVKLPIFCGKGKRIITIYVSDQWHISLDIYGNFSGSSIRVWGASFQRYPNMDLDFVSGNLFRDFNGKLLIPLTYLIFDSPPYTYIEPTTIWWSISILRFFRISLNDYFLSLQSMNSHILLYTLSTNSSIMNKKSTPNSHYVAISSV